MIVQPKNNNIEFVSFNCQGIKRSRQHVSDLCKNADVIALQETWLMPHALDFVNDINKEFGCWAKSSIDTSAGVLRGRPYGGVALMWRSSLFTSAELVQCDSDRIIAVRLTQGPRCVLVFSVYMPTNDDDNLPEFTQCLSIISAIVESSETESVLVLGDFNAHPGTLFGKEMMDFCGEQTFICIDLEKLDANSYTFVSDLNGACRWLDHCIVTAAAACLVTDVSVKYGTYWSDHFPLTVSCNFNIIRPKIMYERNVTNSIKYLWGNREPEQRLKYSKLCDAKLKDIINKYRLDSLEMELICEQSGDFACIDNLYGDIVSALQSAAEVSSDFIPRRKTQKVVGWNRHVRQLHVQARENFSLWVHYGRPRSGYYYENMTTTRRSFKAALKYVQSNQDQIKMNILAQHHNGGNFAEFWKQTKKINKTKTLSECIEGEKNKKKIANLFRNHFNVGTNSDSHVDVNKTRRDSENHHVTITSDQIGFILKNMKRGKSPGHDGLSIEHLVYAGQNICKVLARFFTLCMKYCFLPKELIRTLVVPITKNKTGDISSLDNYRPISLATIVAKVLDRVIYSHLSMLKIDDGQFGFRPQVSTDMAIFSLKQVVSYYTQHGTTVYGCFLDLSRAFDTINHDVLWRKLRKDGSVPDGVVDLLGYWYRNQINNVRWGAELSDSYQLSCGVRQGGLTSPDLFNLYVNGLVEELSSTRVGLRLDGRYVNNLSYADDMVLLSPSIKGLNKLLRICETYANKHDLIYNVKKTEMVIFKAGKGPENVPKIHINGQPVKVVERFRYLGHILTPGLKDDEDIERQRRSLCIIGNMIARKFYKASPDVKITLFKSFCQSFYTCQLWTDYTKKAHSCIRVAYNNIFRHLMGLRRYCSASEMYAEAHVDSFNAIQRKRIASFMSRVDRCNNSIVRSLADRLLQTATYSRWVELTT